MASCPLIAARSTLHSAPPLFRERWRVAYDYDDDDDDDDAATSATPRIQALIRPSSICTGWVLHTYDGFLSLSLSLSLCKRELPIMMPHLCFRTQLSKVPSFLFPSFRGPRCPPAHQSRSWFWFFWGKGGKREGWYVQIMSCIVYLVLRRL